MEMTLDLGSNIVERIDAQAELKGKRNESMAADLIEMGLRVIENQTVKEPNPLLQPILETHELVKEITRCVFDKNKVGAPMLEAEGLITLVEKNIAAFLKGQSAV